jgi:hypothetical protein
MRHIKKKMPLEKQTALKEINLYNSLIQVHIFNITHQAMLFSAGTGSKV